MENAEGDLLRLILRSISDRHTVCGLVLATYRVELTSVLSRMVERGSRDGDVDHVDALATLIARAAVIAELDAVQSDAIVLRERAAAAMIGDEQSEGAMYLAGLQVIDRILDSAKSRAAIGPSTLN